ncbi:MAG: DUF2207 domain-containing protein [Acidimicrobiia bacterium]|nr:DUF2207 domain-containing protein [Acidimicrobiia bacterium]
MKLSTKRTRDRVLIGVGAIVVGVASAAGAALSDGERIADTQIHVAVDQNGSGRIVEAIDYDFGTSSERHGIFRDVPGLTSDSSVEVSSDAPDQFVLLGDRIKIGDPDETISGRYRYEIAYTLEGVAPGGKVAFNGVGAGWDVPITEATIIITGPYDWSGLRCDQGADGRTGGCKARQTRPGRLEVRVTDLASHEGVAVYADQAERIAAAPELPAFRGSPADDSPAILLPTLLAAAAALGAALIASYLVRRAGAEWVGAGGAADAAFPGALPAGVGEDGSAEDGSGSARRIDEAELADMATIEFAPPEGVGAAYGGIILREVVRPEHKVAWLIEQVASGSVSLDETTGTEVLTRTDGPDRPLDPVLDRAFGHRSSIELGSYDPEFAAAWSSLDSVLEQWRDSSGLWDHAGDRNRIRVLVAGILATVLGLLMVAVGAFVALLPLVVVGAVVGGAGLAAAVRSWELRVRTPMGSSLWLRIESFRRFLSGSEVQHVDWAVQHGVLRQYTAWAVAVGEIDRWERAVGESATAMSVDPGATRMVYLAPALMMSTASASTAPSSSGSGGFSGGGVGGGAGGGGGGSW